jgi:Tfp pilus assembly protein PilV
MSLMPQDRGGRDRRAESGLSLIDALVGMTLLSIALVGLAGALVFANRPVVMGWGQSKAAAVAEDLFEKMRTQPYAQINATTFPNQTTVPNYPGLSYTIAFFCQPADGCPADDTPPRPAGTKRVSVSVTYPGPDGPLTMIFSSVFANPQ